MREHGQLRETQMEADVAGKTTDGRTFATGRHGVSIVGKPNSLPSNLVSNKLADRVSQANGREKHAIEQHIR
jgi:hypothetical protein